VLQKGRGEDGLFLPENRRRRGRFKSKWETFSISRCGEVRNRNRSYEKRKGWGSLRGVGGLEGKDENKKTCKACFFLLFLLVLTIGGVFFFFFCLIDFGV